MAYSGISAVILHHIGGTYGKLFENAQCTDDTSGLSGCGNVLHEGGLIDRDSKEKLVDIILRITLPCMIFNSFNNPLTPEVMKQTALILVVAVSISILSFFAGEGYI